MKKHNPSGSRTLMTMQKILCCIPIWHCRLSRIKKYSEALVYYAKARELTPNDPGLLINIGNVYAALDNPAEAFSAYAGALHSPLREKAAYDIFTLAQKKSDTVRAHEMLTLLATEFKTAVLTKRALADAGIRAGDTLKARQLYESIPDTAKDTEDWFALARIYIGYSEFGKAQVCIKHLPDEPQWQRAAIELAARKAYNDKNYSQAFRLFSGLNDTSFAMQYNLALIAFAAHNYIDVFAAVRQLAVTYEQFKSH